MKYRVIRRALLRILFAAGVVIGAVALPVIATGYHMYKEAVDEKPVQEVVETLKQSDSYIPLEQISDDFIELVIDNEDHRFYYHPGFDPIAITRAVYYNLKAGAYVQGASTITQQLAKNLYFSFEKRMERKVAELFVAVELECMYTKDDILELYCNVIYFGENCYGIQSAALHYYDCTPAELTKDQAEALVYTIKCPTKYNPNARAKQQEEKQLAQKIMWDLEINPLTDF